MRRSLLIVLLSLGVAVPATAAASTRGVPPAKARISLDGTDPVRVVGAHFKAREHVKITLYGDATYRKTVMSTRAGRITAVFANAQIGRCNAVAVVARGARGDSASLKIMPMSCPPPAQSPGA